MKATRQELMAAIDALPEQKHALRSDQDMALYRKATERVCEEMGYTEEEFIDVLLQSMKEEFGI